MVSHEISASVCCYLIVAQILPLWHSNASYELHEPRKVIFVLAVVSISIYQASGQCSYHSRAHRMRKEVQCHKHVIMHTLLSEDRTQAVNNRIMNFIPPPPLLLLNLFLNNQLCLFSL